MAKKLAVATLITGPDWQKLAQFTLPSLRSYAERLRADFVIMDKQIHAHPHYDKWQLYDLLTLYDRIIYLDADMVVRPDCPNLFVQVPPEFVGGENELLSFPGQAKHLARFCARLNLPTLPCRYYINGGMIVASACHRQLFRPPEAVFTDLPWPEQSHLNARLLGEKHPVCLLPSAFNDRHRKGHYLHLSFILHYSCMTMAQRIKAVSHDLAEWKHMFAYTEPSNALVSTD